MFKQGAQIINAGIKVETEYRIYLFIQVLISTIIPLILTIMIWNSVYSSNPMLMDKTGLTMLQMVGYIIFANFLYSIIKNDPYEVSEEIRSGSLNKYLLQPYSYFKNKFFTSLAKFIVNLLVFLVPLMAAFIYFRIETYKCFYYFLFLILSFSINFMISMLLGLITFWLMNVSNVYAMIGFISSFLSGSLIPINIMPAFIQKISIYLPFRYLAYEPTAILLYNKPIGEILRTFTGGIVWVMILFLLYKIVWKLGMRKYEAFSG